MTVKLKHVPKEIQRLILLEQADMKLKCNCIFSQEQTVLMILRKWDRVKHYSVKGITVNQIAEELFSVKGLSSENGEL